MSITILDNVEEVRSFMSQKGLSLLYVGMNGCRPCVFYSGNFEQAAGGSDGSCSFGKVIVNEVPDVNDILGVTSVPTTIVFKDGKELHRVIGLLESESVLELISEFKNK